MALDLSTGRGRNRKNLAGAALLVASVVLISGFVALRLALPGNVCNGPPTALLAVVLDVTSRLSDAQRLDLGNRLRARVHGLPAGGRVEFWRVSPSVGLVPKPLGEPTCRPDPSPSEWTQNKSRAEDANRGFAEQVEAMLEVTLTSAGEQESPILESVQAVWLRFLGDGRWPPEVSRQLILASDLVQNTSSLTFYSRLPKPDQLGRHPEYQKLRVPLRGAEVELLYLKHDDGVESGALIELWEWMIADMGGNLTRVSRITG